jgi:cytochrome c peroxidase
MSIAAFERMLTTPCRFDNYLQGNMQALRNEEKHGLSVFIKSGCITCHNGPLLGGNAFKKFGQETDYHALTNSSNADEGRKKVTNNAADKDVFKVPSLRNIAKTHPYFHDGSVSDLNKAISIMGKTQLNKNLTDEEISAIASFLQSLTGSVPEDALKIPEGVSLVKN